MDARRQIGRTMHRLLPADVDGWPLAWSGGAHGAMYWFCDVRGYRVTMGLCSGSTSYAIQLRQWSTGCMRILFAHTPTTCVTGLDAVIRLAIRQGALEGRRIWCDRRDALV